jgi:hypothetical protein
MTAFFPARAPTRDGPARSSPIRRRVAGSASRQHWSRPPSGGWWESADYAIGYATCDAPLGPCNRATIDGPLLASTGDAAGPDGACVVNGPTGDQWLAYHAWTPGAVGYDAGGARSLRFASLVWSGPWPVVGR